MSLILGKKVYYTKDTKITEIDGVVVFDGPITTPFGDRNITIIEAPISGWVPNENNLNKYNLDQNKKYLFVNESELIIL